MRTKGGKELYTTLVGNITQSTAKQIAGLQELTLRTMDKSITEDYIYKDCYINGILIENAIQMAATYCVMEDINGEVIIVAFNNTENVYKIDMFTVGQKIALLNPYVRHSFDGTVCIRVDDPKSILFDDFEKICWCCSRTEEQVGNNFINCNNCKRAVYCSRHCLQSYLMTNDHKSVCY